METSVQYLTCPQRPGNPRVAQEVCRQCRRSGRCQAWRDYRCPSLFPGLNAAPAKRGQA
jgi:hypothetical protein